MVKDAPIQAGILLGRGDIARLRARLASRFERFDAARGAGGAPNSQADGAWSRAHRATILMLLETLDRRSSLADSPSPVHAAVASEVAWVRVAGWSVFDYLELRRVIRQALLRRIAAGSWDDSMSVYRFVSETLDRFEALACARWPDEGGTDDGGQFLDEWTRADTDARAHVIRAGLAPANPERPAPGQDVASRVGIVHLDLSRVDGSSLPEERAVIPRELLAKINVLSANPEAVALLGASNQREVIARIEWVAGGASEMLRTVVLRRGSVAGRADVKLTGGHVVQFTATATLSPSEHPLGSVTLVFWDTTQALHRDRVLRQQASVFASTGEGALITDLDGTILRVNRAFVEMMGYSEEEVIGRNPRLLQSGLQGESFYRAMWSSLETTGSWVGEIQNMRSDGTIVPCWERINLVRAPGGQPLYYVAMLTDITALKHAEARTSYLAHHDALTGLPNRVLFADRVEVAIRRCQRRGTRCAVMVLDLDRFKSVNESMGHAAGDALLVEVATRLRGAIRDTDTVARMGGDEFVVLAEDVGERPGASRVAQRLIDALEAPVDVAGHETRVGASIGIAVYPDDGRNRTDLLRLSDVAMFRAKTDGGRRWRFVSEDMSRDAMLRFQVETRLRSALDAGEFRVVYQPQVGLDGTTVRGVEALVRWSDSTGRTVSPARFIPIAEESGLIVPLGAWILEQACRQMIEWDQSNTPVGRMCVNVSARQLGHSDFVETVSSVVGSCGLAFDRLEIELTESAMRHQLDQVTQNLMELRALGVHIALDDFGTGYSSLAELHALPVGVLKIDREFVRKLDRESADRSVARAIITIGTSLGLSVIAEGIESPGQRDLLMEMGCELGQGWLYSRAEDPHPLSRRLLSIDGRTMLVPEAAGDG